MIGSESVRHLVASGYDVIGIENDMRARFFGPNASTSRTTQRLRDDLGGEFRSLDVDIRDADGVRRIIRKHAKDLSLLIHTAAQPSHDWAASDAQMDFSVNANGTMNLLEAVRHLKPDATFIFMSTNKVYGDHPNRLPLYETDARLELPEDHEYYGGIDTSMSIDHCTHSLFGVSKIAADVMVQEYGRYFELPTVAFRGGCLTGPNHAGARLHGFLSYLMRCTVTGEPYTVYGYKGKQVRDNIHAFDVASFIERFLDAPRVAEVYNLGGGRGNSCSIIEAFAHAEAVSGRKMVSEYVDQNREGDHICYISDLAKIKSHYPSWDITKSLIDIFSEIHHSWVERTKVA